MPIFFPTEEESKRLFPAEIDWCLNVIELAMINPSQARDVWNKIDWGNEPHDLPRHYFECLDHAMRNMCDQYSLLAKLSDDIIAAYSDPEITDAINRLSGKRQ